MTTLGRPERMTFNRGGMSPETGIQDDGAGGVVVGIPSMFQHSEYIAEVG